MRLNLLKKMSAPNLKSERIEAMLDRAPEFMNEFTGERGDVSYLIEEIKNPEKRSSLYEIFEEWFDEVFSKYV